jgi:hypothetical protein
MIGVPAEVLSPLGFEGAWAQVPVSSLAPVVRREVVSVGVGMLKVCIDEEGVSGWM